MGPFFCKNALPCLSNAFIWCILYFILVVRYSSIDRSNMQVIAVVNPKGGAGKSTFSTNLAGYLASQGHNVMLGDVDIQQSSRRWLANRPKNLRKISAWEIGSGHGNASIRRPPEGTTHVVLDTPGGISGARLEGVLEFADKVVVPLQASIFDIQATQDFLNFLIHRKNSPNKSTSKKIDVGVLGMRVNLRTLSAEQLRLYVHNLGLPVLGCLRDTQNYVQLAAHGATIWDVAPSKVEIDVPQWSGVIEWLKS